MYYKTLISIGVVNTLIAASYFLSFYPQVAAYTVIYNLYYLINRFTLITIKDNLPEYIAFALNWSFLLLSAIYCFVTAAKTKRAVAKPVRLTKKNQ